MIYDHGPLTVYERDGAPADGRLKKHSEHYYAPLTVYHRRFWESVQAGDRVDTMVQLPFGEDLNADLFVVPEDGLGCSTASTRPSTPRTTTAYPAAS